MERNGPEKAFAGSMIGLKGPVIAPAAGFEKAPEEWALRAPLLM